jgi:two-component system phosphate regulon response regulator OmpR
MRVLVVEDEAAVAGSIKGSLERGGFRVDLASNGEDAWILGDTEDFAAVILDLGLPRMDGLSVLRRWRAAGRRMPVIILTARGTWMERVEGIDAGADDYLPKPFDPRELILRINNILRRGGPQAVPKVKQIVFGPYTFQIARRELKKGGEPLKLTDREQEILAIFAERAGETIPRHELVSGSSEVGERTIDVQINRLRRKIERDPANPVWLQTVRGIGYRLSVE